LSSLHSTTGFNFAVGIGNLVSTVVCRIHLNRHFLHTCWHAGFFDWWAKQHFSWERKHPGKI